MREYINLIENASGRRETFEFKNPHPMGGKVWFYLDFDADGNLIGLEEHDHYQGGSITNRKEADETLRDLFLRRVATKSENDQEIIQNAETYV